MMKKYKYLLLSLSSIVFIIAASIGCNESKEPPINKSSVLIESEEKMTKSRVERLPYFEDPSFLPHWLSAAEVETQNFHKVADYELQDQRGLKFTQEMTNGKVYVANFFFSTCPGICTDLMRSIEVIQEIVACNDDVLILSHTATPSNDTSEILAKYGKEKGIDPQKWYLLTGDRKVLYSLGRASYFIEEDLGEKKSDDVFLHTENIVLVDRKGYLRGIYNGLNKASTQQLVLDIETLVAE